MADKIRIKKITLPVQAIHLKNLFPESSAYIVRNLLTWKSEITPSPMSQTYIARLRYKLEKKPEIHILQPELHVPEGKQLPHTYSGNRLCLYYPGIGDWRGDMLLSKTIVPWISEWLLHYEIWLVTGKWCGGGKHPRIKKNK